MDDDHHLIYILKPAGYAVKMLGRGGDLDAHPQLLSTSLVPRTDTTDTYRVGILLNRFHRLTGPECIYFEAPLSYTKVYLHGRALSISFIDSGAISPWLLCDVGA